MNAKLPTHVGVVENYNYGHPTRARVNLRETAKFWVNTDTGTKYRKSDGRPAASTIWEQRELELATVTRKPPVVTHIGASSDGRTNRWRIDCGCGNKILPPTTLLASQQFDCDRCGTTYVANWHEPSVKELAK